jgi:hypothetical protein
MRDQHALIVSLRWLNRAMVALAWLALLTWIIGRVVSDRFLWSQFLLWAPSWIIVPGAAVALTLAWLLWRFAYPRYDSIEDNDRSWKLARPGFRSARWRRVAWCMFGVVALGMLFAEWRLHRAVFSREPAPQALRLIVWNPSEMNEWERTHELMIASKPDMLAIANPPYSRSLAGVASSMGDKTNSVMYNQLALLSKYPVMRWGGARLQVTGARVRKFTWEGGGMLNIDRGFALLVQLDTTKELGRPTVVWIVDLPSDPDIPRDRMMREARSVLDSMTTYLARDELGRDVADTWPDPTTNPLRTPDIIVGDTNTPRGSRSLDMLTNSELIGAFEQSGWGPSLTYPRRVPLLAIDHVFTRSWLRVDSYRVIDNGLGRHRLQEALISPAK